MEENLTEKASKDLHEYLKWQYENAKELSRKEGLGRRDYCYYKGRREAFLMALAALKEIKDRGCNSYQSFLGEIEREVKHLLEYKYDYPDSAREAIKQVLDFIEEIAGE